MANERLVINLMINIMLKFYSIKTINFMINFDQMVKNIPQGYLIFGLIMSIFSLILCLIYIGLLLVLSKMRF